MLWFHFNRRELFDFVKRDFMLGHTRITGNGYRLPRFNVTRTEDIQIWVISPAAAEHLLRINEMIMPFALAHFGGADSDKYRWLSFTIN